MRGTEYQVLEPRFRPEDGGKGAEGSVVGSYLSQSHTLIFVHQR